MKKTWISSSSSFNDCIFACTSHFPKHLHTFQVPRTLYLTSTHNTIDINSSLSLINHGLILLPGCRDFFWLYKTISEYDIASPKTRDSKPELDSKQELYPEYCFQ